MDSKTLLESNPSDLSDASLALLVRGVAEVFTIKPGLISDQVSRLLGEVAERLEKDENEVERIVRIARVMDEAADRLQEIRKNDSRTIS